MFTILRRPFADRELWAERLLDRLTPAMSALGILFLLVVLAEQFSEPGSLLSIVLSVVGWVLWALFAAEFLARLIVAPDTGRFLRRNWWQLLFLLLPFLRFLRLVRAAQLVRTGRVLSSAVRSTRSARQVLSSRVGWLAAVTSIAVLGTSQLLYGFSGYATYGEALHATALAAVTGEPLGRQDAFSQVAEILLAVFCVAVFATPQEASAPTSWSRGEGAPGTREWHDGGVTRAGPTWGAGPSWRSSVPTATS